jgi:hypothetical protein
MPTKYRTANKSLDIPRELHKELKETAARRDETVKDYATRALRERLARERREQS